MKIVVASKNPVKVAAGENAFRAMFPDLTFDCVGVSAESGVSEQPMSSDETLTGARNRVENAREAVPDADYWIAFEGGVEDQGDRMMSVVWVSCLSKTGLVGESECGRFIVPPAVAGLIRSGMEMGHADDQIFGRANSKQQNGAIGLLTHDVLTRESVYTQGGILALIPFKNPELYGQESSTMAA